MPPDIITTDQRPDKVIINRKEKKVLLFELTVCFEKNADAANARRKSRIREKKNLSTDADFRTDTVLERLHDLSIK